MTTTRLQFANALLPAINAPRTAPAVQVVIAWQMAEGQTAGENDPLAMTNEHDPHGTGGAGNRFSFASIDRGLAATARALQPSATYYASIGNAFRAGKPPAELITAIHNAGWCGGPGAPCPGYGASIRSSYNRLSDPAVYAREANVVVGSTSLSGNAGAGGPGGPASSIPGGTSSGATATNVLSPGDLVGPLLGPLGGLLTSPGQVIGDVGTAVGAIGTVFAHLLDPHFWRRVGVFVLGAGMVGAGGIMLGHQFAPNVTDKVTGAAKTAAGGAAAVAAL